MGKLTKQQKDILENKMHEIGGIMSGLPTTHVHILLINMIVVFLKLGLKSGKRDLEIARQVLDNLKSTTLTILSDEDWE